MRRSTLSVLLLALAVPPSPDWHLLATVRADDTAQPAKRVFYAGACAIDIAPEAFLEAVNSALFQSPSYAAYANVMLHPPRHPGATMELGAKDLRLLREAAAGRRTRLTLADHLAGIFAEARQAGLGAEDWAVGQYRIAQQRATLDSQSTKTGAA